LVANFGHYPTMIYRYPLFGGLAALLLAGCSTTAAPDPQTAFMARLRDICGKAFAGKLISNEASDADMVGAAMIMHVRDCSADGVRIPFHVARKDGSWDRSRTWVITRTATGLRLKHDHRHEDGSADKVTQYGGDTANDGTSARQDFAVDQDSIAMFRRSGLPKSVTNIWAVEVANASAPNASFAYELRRTGKNARFFRVEFDLTKPIAPPPPPWGAR
jgi:hypothetical protein